VAEALMRGFRSTLVLFVVLLGLLGYIYFFEMKRPAPNAEPPKQKVFAVEAGTIEELEVRSAGGERTVLKKSGGAWSVAEPLQTGADETEATGIVTNLASLEIQRVVDEAPADLAQFGLASPKVEVAFRASGRKDQQRLQLGDKTATGGELYAKLPAEKRVFLVSAFLDATFNKSTFDLRDKAVLKFERDKVDALTVASAGVPLAFEKKDVRWAITSPQALRADVTAVEGLVGRLQTLQMKSIVASDVADKDLGKYGLDKPAYTATVAAGSARASLAIGKADPSGMLYARDLARPAMVMTVEAALADDLKKPADDYRPKEIFEFRSFSATRLEVTRGTSTLAFEQVKGKDGTTKWHRVNPAKDVDGPEMDGVLNSLAGLMLEQWADAKAKTGLDAPVAIITAKFDDGKKTEQVTFGKVGSEMFAARAGEPGAFKIDAGRFDEAMKALDALK
jgi:hypothetical protein